VLEALRESAFSVVAEYTHRQLLGYIRDSGVQTPWEVRGRIVLAIPAETSRAVFGALTPTRLRTT